MFLFLPFSAMAQGFNISGRILDIETKNAVKGAAVFIASSTFNTVTDSSGHFEILHIPANVFQIVINKPGYETMVFTTSPDHFTTVFRFEMSPDKTKFPPANDSIIKYDPNGWYNLFTHNFLGGSENGTECSIANPEVLRFHFNTESRILSITATDLVQVFNEATGYLMNCDLDQYTINNEGKCSFSGYWWYRELTTQKPQVRLKWTQNRVATYNGSLMHFLRALYIDSLAAQGFEMRMISVVYDDNPDFGKAKRSKQSTAVLEEDIMPGSTKHPRKYVYLISDDVLPTDSIRRMDPKSGALFLSCDYSVKIEYKNSYESYNYVSALLRERAAGPRNSIIFLRPGAKIRLEEHGLYFDKPDLVINGYWEWQRLADTLPFDYHKTEK